MEKEITMDYDTFLKNKEKRRKSLSQGHDTQYDSLRPGNPKKKLQAPKSKKVRLDFYDDDFYDDEY